MQQKKPSITSWIVVLIASIFLIWLVFPSNKTSIPISKEQEACETAGKAAAIAVYLKEQGISEERALDQLISSSTDPSVKSIYGAIVKDAYSGHLSRDQAQAQARDECLNSINILKNMGKQ